MKKDLFDSVEMVWKETKFGKNFPHVSGEDKDGARQHLVVFFLECHGRSFFDYLISNSFGSINDVKAAAKFFGLSEMYEHLSDFQNEYPQLFNGRGSIIEDEYFSIESGYAEQDRKFCEYEETLAMCISAIGT